VRGVYCLLCARREREKTEVFHPPREVTRYLCDYLTKSGVGTCYFHIVTWYGLFIRCVSYDIVSYPLLPAFWRAVLLSFLHTHIFINVSRCPRFGFVLYDFFSSTYKQTRTTLPLLPRERQLDCQVSESLFGTVYFSALL